jgi:hypothetical protein
MNVKKPWPTCGKPTRRRRKDNRIVWHRGTLRKWCRASPSFRERSIVVTTGEKA